ncbi:xanthine dehydrogenase molybdopterin binding subunit [Aliiroseovarius crassostreae]|uniref:xanthine dehydrogenase molybdopterin binding subunit n=1 Tax=Aliiroseovarius crassostreae TaxID=154981 RepID=UPI0021AEFF46|nr:xanthine dehydrogenase molybdopterin binding subunit [Aliiroseovarius crassostreae]UWP89540.1 xanthine dehydrogenase molybdopterin binding subunit [Aliiroseovarius crassostreae]
MSIGKPLPHDAAHLHVTGAARYVDDIPTPSGTLHLCFSLSDVARGKITAMDLAAVRAAPGVVAVLTADDLPFENDVSPSIHDEPLLAVDEVFYLGQPIFLVIADSHLNARKAARLGQIDIDPLPAILTIDQALEADSRFEEGPVIWSRGDTSLALKHAPHIIEGRFEMGGQEHFYLEGQAALALPGEDGDMLVHSSTQHPSEIQHKVAHAIGLPMHAARVETRRMGGGFGGKESQGNALAVACAIAARQTGRPCKMRYDRDDDMMITGKRHDFRIAYRVGVDETGKILGLEITQMARCGWAQDLSLPVADRAMLHTDNAYHLENVEITSHRLKTHTQSATAFRGFGGPQGVLGIERILDHVARTRGLDPIAVRQVNFYADGQTTHYGQEIEGFHIPAMTEALLERAEYATRRADIDAFNARNPVLKKGLAFVPVKFGISFTLTHLNQAGALVHVYQDGSVHLNHGGTEMGQGLFQKVAQVAASVFAVDLSAIRITATDTAKVPNTSATAASSGSDLNGMAVRAACLTIRDRISAHLATYWSVAPGDVVFTEGRVQAAGRVPLSFAEAAQMAYLARVSLSATGFYKTPRISWDRTAGRGRPFLYFSHGVALSEVVIDTLTGENRILRADIIHDTGNSLNPALDIGQVEGAYVQGAGWLTTEELVWDDTGRLRTHAPSTYKIPASSDRPRQFTVDLWHEPNPEDTVGRSKAVGEPPFMLGISAWLALADAVAACGTGFHDLNAPATAEEVLGAIGRVQS